MLALLFVTTVAHAGLWSALCESFIAPDPFQFQDASADWLDRQVERLEIKRRWQTLSKEDGEYLSIMRAELKRRDLVKGLSRAADK